MFDVRRSTFLLCLFVSVATIAQAAPIFPTTTGTTWDYAQTGAEPSRFSISITGRETVAGQELMKLVTKDQGEIIQTQLVTATEKGLLFHGRRSADGTITSFEKPRVLLPFPLAVGGTWELDDDVAGMAMHQVFKVVAEESVKVPAGDFRAYHLHCEQPWPLSVSIDRWFAPGTGFVKDVTVTRGPTGRLLSRATTVLTKFSVVPPAPEPPPSVTISIAPSTPTPPPQVTLEVAAARDGPLTTAFQADAENIFVHWQGEHLALNTMVRVAWIAEDVGDLVEPNFVVDETETEVTAPEFGARFTLSRPSDGWAAGKYRLELYLDDVLSQKLEVSITEPAKKSAPSESPPPKE